MQVYPSYNPLGQFDIDKTMTDVLEAMNGLLDSANIVEVGGWSVVNDPQTGSSTLVNDDENTTFDSASGAIYINDTTFGNQGIQFEYNSGTPRGYIGNGGTEFFQFDGTNLSWQGSNSSLSAGGAFVTTEATIGGWTVNANAIQDTAGVVGMSSAATGADDIRFWAGDATPASAEFRVYESGAFVASSATITGSVTATSGAIGGWDIGATTLSANTNEIILDSGNRAIYINSSTYGNEGIQLEFNTGVPRMYIGDGVAQYFEYDGSDISWKGNNAELTAAGALNVSNIAATGGTIGGTTITATTLYGGIIQTAATVDAGHNGVVMDSDGLRGYDTILGEVFNIPTDGSAPTFSSGVINYSTFNVDVSGIIQTSDTVGDGTAASAGIIMNSSGLFGCEANQLAANANFKLLVDGTFALSTSQAGAITINNGGNILVNAGGDIRFSRATAPGACVAALAGAAGNVDAGDHYYKITFFDGATGETELGTASNLVTTVAGNQQVNLTSIPTSTSSVVTQRKIYRTKAGGSSYYYLATIANNTTTTYTDNTADAGLGADISNLRQNTLVGVVNWSDVGSSIVAYGDTIGFGKYVFEDLTTGYYNVALGDYALMNLTSGWGNTIVGYAAGITLTTGTGNTFFGGNAGHNSSTGNLNIAIGESALFTNTTDSYNIAIGRNSLFDSNGGQYNVAIGDLAQTNITTGDYNISIGGETLSSCLTGSNNVSIGDQSGFDTTGSGNVFLGYQAGYQETGSNKLYIENSNSSSPLIYGEFDNDLVYINGHFGVKGGNEFRYWDVGSSNYVGFEAPALTANQIWVLPSADTGTAGSPLYSDAAGNLGWGGAGEGIDISAAGVISGEDASTTNKGILETATDAEAQAHSATDKALTPANLNVEIHPGDNIELLNNKFYQVRDSGGTGRNIVGLTSGDVATYAMAYQGLNRYDIHMESGYQDISITAAGNKNGSAVTFANSFTSTATMSLTITAAVFSTSNVDDVNCFAPICSNTGFTPRVNVGAFASAATIRIYWMAIGY